MKNRNLIIGIIGCLTIGLAPFKPEPHLFGKLRWIAGGGEGMQLADYFDLLMHGLPWIFLFFVLGKMLFGSSEKVDLAVILNDANVNIIDVREPREVASGMISGAKNMPLSEFKKYIPEIQKMEGKKVLYCKSGMRSGRATSMLKKNGITDAYNGGGYSNMKSKVS